MTTKDYLKQVKVLDRKIRHKESQLRELEARIMQAGGMDYEHERVSTSPKGDRLADDVIRMVELKEQISAERAEYFEKKEMIVNQIHKLEDARYIDILVKRYVELKAFDVIAAEMHYSERRVYYLHREALQALTFIK